MTRLFVVSVLLALSALWARAEYNVKDYGALGDNATDDTVAIQAAIDAADNAGGETVFFPKGTYKTTDTLVVGTGNTLATGRTSHVTLEGAAHHAAIINYYGAATALRFNMEIGGGLQKLDILNANSLRGVTQGLETSGPPGGSGTYTHDLRFEEVKIQGFHIGWKTSSADGTSTSSEITSINLTLANNDTGFYNSQFNGLNFVFIQLEMSFNGIGVDAETSGIHVFGGSASYDGMDFKFRNQGANGIYDFRSEVPGTFVDAAGGKLTIANSNCKYPTALLAVHTASLTVIDSSQIEGDIGLDGGGTITINNSTFGKTAVLLSGITNGQGLNYYELSGCTRFSPNVLLPHRTGILVSSVMYDNIIAEGAPFPNASTKTTIRGANINFLGLPIADPHVAGQLWNNGGVVSVSQ